MDILNTVSLESNSQIRINFDGGDLSSDAGLLLFKEFLYKIGAVKLIHRMFKTNDTAGFRIHKDDALASQPTLSRFFNRMDTDTLSQLNQITRELRKVIYSIKKPEFMLFDIDSTLLDAYGNQEGEGFNYHYQVHGYHPLLCYDGLTGDPLKAELRDGTMYCSKEADIFMKSLLDEFICDFEDVPLYLRGDSGFASPDLYEVLEDKNCKYAIRLKENAKLRKLAEDENQALYCATKFNQVDYAVEYGEFMYQAGSWSHPRRVVFKIEKPCGQMIHLYTFIVTTMEMDPYQVIQFYCGRGKMENFIKEGKSGFDFASVSSSSRKYFKLCSSCPYKKEFYETLENIRNLQPQLE